MKTAITVNPIALQGKTDELRFTFIIHPQPKKSSFLGIISKKCQEHTINFRVADIRSSKGIVYTDKLFQIKQTIPDAIKYKDGDPSFSVDVVLDIVNDAITSICENTDIKIYFSLIGEESNNIVVKEDNEIIVSVRKYKPTIEAKIILDNDEFHYVETGRKRIGDFIVYYDAYENAVIKQPNIDFEVLLTLKTDKGEDILGLLWQESDIYSNSKYIASNISPKRKDINGYSRPVRVIPLYIDCSKLSALKKERTSFFIAMQHGRFCCSLDKDRKYDLSVEKEHFVIIKEIVPSTFSLYVNELSNEPADISEQNSYHLQKRSFTPGSNLVSSVDIVIRNKASEEIIPQAGLYISDISIFETGAQQLFLRDKEGKQITSVITVTNDFSRTINNDGFVLLPDGSDEKLSIKLEFNPSRIKYIGKNIIDFEIYSTIEVTYWENANALPTTMLEQYEKKKNITIVWHLHLLPRPEWLCVDYGSSAIACKYDKSLIDLKLRKEEVIRSDSELTKYRRDDLEKGTKFLNSDILLYESPQEREKAESSLCSEQEQGTFLPYSYQAVFLAPTSSLLKDRFLTQIPCLKILVGNEILPKHEPYEMFGYYHKDGSGSVVKEMARDVDNKEQCLLYVNTLFAESYHILFKYFIAGKMEDVRDINKLALTYPNTYTPYHLSVLKRIAQNVFPRLRTLTFVSESDAVAAYYMDHWKEYHADIKKLKNPEGECVLVYDMGAGTLDVTYFKQEWNATKCYHKLDIIGKLGTGRAGNYIDYVIATIVCRLAGIDTIIARTDIKGDGDVYSQRVILKQVVKSQIKPKLSGLTNQVIQFTLQNEGGIVYSVNTNDILADQDFNDCLDECTFGVIDKLKKYLDKKRPIINTVIMSGRSCKLVPLQKRLQEAVVQNSRTTEIEFITLDSPSNVKMNSKEDRQKTVVAEGAEIIARDFSTDGSRVRIISKRLYASFGVSYINANGDIDYTELVNRQDAEATSKTGTILLTAPQKITISQNCQIQLIQSYLNKDDTIMYLQEGNLEYVSLMESFDTEEFPDSNLIIRLKIDELDNVSLIINNCQSAGIPPKGVDLQNPIIKKSLWPLVFNT